MHKRTIAGEIRRAAFERRTASLEGLAASLASAFREALNKPTQGERDSYAAALSGVLSDLIDDHRKHVVEVSTHYCDLIDADRPTGILERAECAIDVVTRTCLECGMGQVN